MDDLSYIGSGKTSQRYSELAALHIKGELLKGEAALYRTKWWDYRFMHPMDATYRFAYEYAEALRRALVKRKDHRMVYLRAFTAEEAGRKFRTDDFLKSTPAVITGLWKARRLADEHGVPYDFWCRFAMKIAEAGDWRYLPRPTQLYSHARTIGLRDGDKRSLVDLILAGWQEKGRREVIFSRDPYYRECKTPLHPYQSLHMRAVVEQLRASQAPRFAVADLVYRNRILPEAIVTKIFGEDAGGNLLRQAKTLVA